MKKIVIILSIFAVVVGACGQKAAQEFYDETFKWKITIPEKLKAVNPEKWAKSKERGFQAIEDTYGETIEDYTIPIFIFNNGQFNVFEAMYEPFDPDVDGDFLETCKLVHEIVYGTFITQMPNAVIDTLTTIEQIDNLDFYVFKIKITYPNKMTMNMLMHSRLFDKHIFGLTHIAGSYAPQKIFFPAKSILSAIGLIFFACSTL